MAVAHHSKSQKDEPSGLLDWLYTLARELADGHEDRDGQTADARFGLVEGTDTL